MNIPWTTLLLTKASIITIVIFHSACVMASVAGAG